MASEFDLTLNPLAAGWTVWWNLFSGGLVWDGSAFVTDTTANRNLGGIATTEISTARFVGSVPSAVETSGTYPVIGYRQLGGSYAAATDTVVTLGGSYVEYVTTAGSTLERSPSEVVQQLLIDGGVCTEGGQGGAWPAFATSEPDDLDGLADEIVVTYDTQGIDDLRTMNDGKLYAHHGVQVLVRAATHGRGYGKASAIRAYLSESVRQTYTTVAGDARYLVHAVTKIGDVIPIGRDSPTSKRLMFTVNVTVAMTKVSL